MTDPRRLFDDASGVERAMLCAGRGDAPPRGASRRAAIALGVATGAAVTTGATTTAAATATTGGTLLGVSAATVKLIGAGILSSVVLVVAARTALPPDAPPPARAMTERTVRDALAKVATARAAPARRPARAVASSAPAAVPAPAASTVARADAPPSSASSATPAVADPPKPAQSLTDELAQLDRARAAFNAGNPAGALALVDEYDARFPGSTFGMESIVLRIDALAALGRTSLALQYADAFLAAYPNAPMSRHVRSIVEHLRGPRAIP